MRGRGGYKRRNLLRKHLQTVTVRAQYHDAAAAYMIGSPNLHNNEEPNAVHIQPKGSSEKCIHQRAP